MYFILKNLIALFTFLIVGCTNTKSIIKETIYLNPIEGTWVLKNVLMGDAMDKPCGFSNEGEKKEMNLTFTAENSFTGDKKKLYGQSSVNDFFGWYTILSFNKKSKTGKIQFFSLNSTKMASIETAFMDCENRYFSFLEKSEDFKIEEGRLQLSKTYSIPKAKTGNLPFVDNYRNVLFFDKK